MITVHQGDCLNAIASIQKRHTWVTDPPANIGFMGRKWDKASGAGTWQPRYVHPSANLNDLRSDNEFIEYWAERFGAMNDLTEDDGVAIVWALPRTQHLTQTALRYAGWKVPFVFSHLHGQGWNKNGGHLKPGHESWLIAVKGAYELGIEGCRIPRGEALPTHNGGHGTGVANGAFGNTKPREWHTNGAHPIDVGLSHCDACNGTCCRCCPIRIVDEQSGNRPGMSGGGKHRTGSKGGMFGAIDCETAFGDQGGASRFFHNFHYFAKAGGRTDEQGVPSGERHAGCEDLYWRANKKNPFGFDRVTREEWERLEARQFEGKAPANGHDKYNKHKADQRARGNVHPTVKSLALMMHLVKLAGALIPRDEPFRVGDLCTGSGGTAIACQLLGAEFDGAELCPEAIEIANARLVFWAGVTPATLAEFVTAGEMPTTTTKKLGQGSLFE
jgi:DNA modification methylase